MADQSEVNLRRGNESFYRSDPASYLETRLQMLVIAGAKRAELGQMLADGVAYAGVTIGPAPDGTDEPDADDRSLDRFLTIESQQLLHHACETALRLFLVHASGTSTPWIELNRERSPRRFKEIVKTTFIAGDLDPALVAYVCLGSRTPRDGTPQNEWDQAVGSIKAFLREFARCMLDDAEVYNGIKHGLGVSAGDAVLIVDTLQLGGGPSVEFPVSGSFDDHGTRVWSIKTRWIDVRWSLGMVKVAADLISSIWAIGRYRHLGGEPTGRIWFPGGFRPEDLRSVDRVGGQQMTWHIAEETDPRRAKP